MLVTNTPVSRSLGATFSKLIGQPTPLELRVSVPTIVALVTGTTKTLPSSVASSELVEVSVTATEADVAPLPIVILSESHAMPVTEQTHTASPSLPATEGQTTQSSRFLTAPQRPTRLLLSRRPTLRFWCLTPKGERD